MFISSLYAKLQMLRRDHCLPVDAKSVSVVKYSLINNRNWIHVVSDVTLHVNITPLTAEDRLLRFRKQRKAGLLKK